LVDAHFKLAQMCNKEGDTAEAKRILGVLLKLEPHNDILRQYLADIVQSEKAWAAMPPSELLTQAFKDMLGGIASQATQPVGEPQSEEVQSMIAMTIEHLEKAVRLDDSGTYWPAHSTLANALEWNGDFEGAERECRR
jgi:hypothetical protein